MPPLAVVRCVRSLLPAALPRASTDASLPPQPTNAPTTNTQQAPIRYITPKEKSRVRIMFGRTVAQQETNSSSSNRLGSATLLCIPATAPRLSPNVFLSHCDTVSPEKSHALHEDGSCDPLTANDASAVFLPPTASARALVHSRTSRLLAPPKCVLALHAAGAWAEPD